MSAVYGLYRDGQSAQEAVNRLRAAGLSEGQITILSSEPMDEYAFGQIDKATWMWRLASLGGLLGMAAAFGLAWVTETSWPIDTGGLPIFAWWPNLIIFFEMTMLGVILATAVTLVVAAGLGRRRTLYDPDVSDGKILVGVEDAPVDAVAELKAALGAPAGAEVRTV